MIQCSLEEHVPIPTGVPTPGEIPVMQARAAAACRAAALLCREGYDAPMPPEDRVQQGIRATMAAVAEGRSAPREFNELMLTPTGAIRVNAVLTAYDMEVVKDSKRLRHYITNKLVIESDSFDPKIRLKALELLGKITDVALFTERSEITLGNRSTSELESLLKEKLRRFLPKEGATTEDIEEAVIVPNAQVRLEANTAEMLA